MNQELKTQPIPAVNPNQEHGHRVDIENLKRKGLPDWIIKGVEKWNSTPPPQQRQRNAAQKPQRAKSGIASWADEHKVTSAPWISLMDRMAIKPHKRIITLVGGPDGVGKSIWAEAFASEYFPTTSYTRMAKDMQADCYADPIRTDAYKRHGLLVIDHEQDRGTPPSEASRALFSSIIISRYDAGKTTIILTIRPFTHIAGQFTPAVWSRMTAEDSHVEDCWRWPSYRTGTTETHCKRLDGH